jgi:hypothetical protein
MNKFILSTTLALTLTVGFSVSANTEESTTTDAGITSDQFSYFFDTLWEDLKLTFTFNSEEEAKLLVDFAKERLAEAEALKEEEKKEYVQELVEDYLSLLEHAQEKVSEVVTEEEIEDEAKEELSEQLEEASEIEEQLEEEVKEEVTKIMDKAFLVANVVMGYDTEQVISLREQGFGYGVIAKIISLSDISGKTVEEIVALVEDGETDLEALMAELGITMAQIKESVVSKKAAHVEEALAEAVEAEDAKSFEKEKGKIRSENKAGGRHGKGRRSR